MARLFFSYSHVDEGLRDQLEKHLVTLKRQGVIETWHDRRISAGQEVGQAIDAHVESDDIILLLVSPDFLASDYCYDREMSRAMERHESGKAKVIPVILRACDWRGEKFGKLNAVPRDGQPITQWADRDQAFLEVARAIRAAADSLKQASSQERQIYKTPMGSTSVTRQGIGAYEAKLRELLSQIFQARVGATVSESIFFTMAFDEEYVQAIMESSDGQKLDSIHFEVSASNRIEALGRNKLRELGFDPPNNQIVNFYQEFVINDEGKDIPQIASILACALDEVLSIEDGKSPRVTLETG